MRVFLVGFMGSGKSYWGRRWAENMGFDFIDLDEVIEAKLGKTVSDIFEKEGEELFRQTESDELRRLDGRENTIISCGGGTPCFHDNMDWMNASGITVYLSSTPKLLFDNIMLDSARRPLVKDVNDAEILYFVEKKLKERIPFYEKATITLPVTAINDQSLEKLLNH
jgi:shikimate kinase